MNIRHKKKAKATEIDPVIGTLDATITLFRTKGRQIIISLVTIILVVGISTALNMSRGVSDAKARNAFGQAIVLYSENNLEQAKQAFNIVADEYGSTHFGAYSNYMLGMTSLTAGNASEAIVYLEKAASHKKARMFVRAAAYEALGVCFEENGDIESALNNYQKVLTDEAASHRYSSVRWKMALLQKKNGNSDEVLNLCNEILSDTLVNDYVASAKNMLATVSIDK